MFRRDDDGPCTPYLLSTQFYRNLEVFGVTMVHVALVGIETAAQGLRGDGKPARSPPGNSVEIALILGNYSLEATGSFVTSHSSEPTCNIDLPCDK